MIARSTGSWRPIARRDWPLLIVSSALGLILNQWLFVTGLSMTTAINSTLISTCIPVATFFVGILLATERATWRRTLGIALAAAGVLLLVGPHGGDFSAQTRIGDLLIVSNALCYGVYIAISKNLMMKYSAMTVITWIFIIGTVATLPAGVVSLSRIQVRSIPLIVWFEVAYIIVLPTAGAYFLNAWALARVPPSTVAVYIYLQPLVAFVLAPIVLGEAVGVRAIISTLLIFAGVYLVTRRGRSRRRNQSEIFESAQ
jgi:drug/metabolite transporter (DMT)-like permease